MKTLRTVLGTLVYDWPTFLVCMLSSAGWVRMRNRNDQISLNPDEQGVRCDWEYTRPLHLCNVGPATANWLLRRAVKAHSFVFKDSPGYVTAEKICRNDTPALDDSLNVSFLIGHKGLERLPLLLLTLKAIAAQESGSFECIVVEQDEKTLVKDQLPEWVRYVHAPRPASGGLYNRSQAFNDAARVAEGDVLILHDNDMLVPVDYVSEAFRVCQEGYDVVQLKRFVFYLKEASSRKISSGKITLNSGCCEQVVENACGGGSVVISRDVYWDIGGMDEDFVGWGGEDEEFWDRCLTRKVWEYAYLPLVHLWHEAQPGKRAVNGKGVHTADLVQQRRDIPPGTRIERLKQKHHLE